MNANAEEQNWRKPSCVAKAEKASLFGTQGGIFGTQGGTFGTLGRFLWGDGDIMILGTFSFGTLVNVTCRTGI